MSTLSIILIILAAITGFLVAFLINGKTAYDEHNVSNNDKSCYDKEFLKIKEDYERKLSEAKVQYDELNKQLENSLNENTDEVLKSKIEEVKKLRRQIDDFEEEIEDLEDEKKSLKKKLSDRDSECQELELSVNEITRQNKDLSEDLENVNHSLDIQRKETAANEEALSFVQEILCAKEHNNEDYEKINSEISDMLRFFYNDFFEATQFISGQFKEEYIEKPLDVSDSDVLLYVYEDYIQQWKYSREKYWTHEKTSIAFVGEFSAGKTSIVNRILSQDNPDIPLLPVSAKATTAIATYISGGSNTLYSFYSPDGKLKEMKEETFKSISKEVLDKTKGISSMIKYFVMTYNNPNLNGISILDTPGFSSNDKEDADRTMEVINECDSLFWVFDVNSGTINRSSMDTIKKGLKKPLYVVINKVDTKPESEVDKVEKLVKDTLESNGIKVEKYIRFSSKSDLNDIMQPIKSVSRDKVRDEIFSYIDTSLKSYNKLVKGHEKYLKEEVLRLDSEFDNEADEFINILKENQSKCEDALDIPKLKNSFWSGTYFKMEEEEYDKFAQLINDIVDGQVDANDSAAKILDLSKQYNEMNEKYQIYNNKSREFDRILTKYKKIIKKIKTKNQ